MWIGKHNKAFKFFSYAGQCWDFSGYESALAIWFVVEKINRWFSQQGFFWHEWTCWLTSGYFCVISEFLGVLMVGLEIRLLCVEAPAPLALICGWLWRRRCMCEEMSYTLCCAGSVAAAPLLPLKPPGPWLLRWCLFVLQSCQFVLQTHPAILPCCCWERGYENEECVSFNIRHPQLTPLWVKPLLLLPTCFSHTGLGWSKLEGVCWWGHLWRKGAMAEAL